MRQEESYKRGHCIVLLFLFLFGALMTLLYMPAIKERFPENESFALLCMLWLMFTASLLVSSINGIVALPLLTVLFGSATAFEADRARLLFACGNSAWLEAIITIIIVPLFFAVCNWGMGLSLLVRELTSRHTTEYGKKKFITYTVMLLGAAAFAVAQRLIKI